ncbi:MAG TPA: methyltransferase domain-containing protein [Candidatus Nanopelagicales bacterium]
MTRNPWDARRYDDTFGFVAQHGDALLDLLDVQPGERVLDLGCGTGRHAGALAAAGALVVGLDADPAMLARARAEHPDIAFVAADAAEFGLAELGAVTPFDACLSNAALHWMTPHDAVLRNVRAVLREGGRFVAELGGAQNIATLDAALRDGLHDLGLDDAPVVRNHFPTVGEEASALEAVGFRVEQAAWWRRPTPLPEGTSAADWTRQFRATTWAAVPAERHQALHEAIDGHAAALGLLEPEGWVADYCRLRFVAVAV